MTGDGWVPIPRYRYFRMTFLQLEPCGHTETVQDSVGHRWWGCGHCLELRTIRVACDLPLTWGNVR